jgi:hypothetical protein
MRSIFILTYLYLLLFVSCTSKTENITEVKPYFDLKKYFTEQAGILNKQDTKLQKQITKDGKTEVEQFTSVNWQLELKPFSDCDINKPSWFHSYFADTNFVAGEMRVKYIARDASLQVQQILLIFENNQLTRLYIDKESINSYYHSKNSYAFIPAEGFSINGAQEVMLARKTNYSIVAKFVKRPA